MIANPISNVLTHEWRTWLPISVIAFISAGLLMIGWPAGLAPDLTIPFSYAGDGMAYLWNVQRVIEDIWYFKNDRSGFPFGSNHLDYPTADTGSYLVLKLLGFIYGTSIAAVNVYYLLGFSVCTLATYLVSRALNINKYFSIATALIYAFSSFHFGRLGHLFFTWYFVAPLFFYLGFRLIFSKLIFFNTNISIQEKFLNLVALLVLSSFGIYYSLFGCMVVTLCTLIGVVLHRSVKYIYEGLSILGVIVFGVLLNVFPSLLYIFQSGENREGVHRLAPESELYALKITQLLLPRGDHRLDSFFELAHQYNSSFPLVTENISASLGMIGSLGFLILIGTVLSAPFLFKKNNIYTIHNQSSINLKLNILATVTLGLLLFSTLGGFSSLFAMLVSSSIRSWNRISIFIAFASILTFFLLLDTVIKKYLNLKYQTTICILIVVPIIVLGILDQTTKPCHSCRLLNKQLIENDRAFIQKVEASLPSQSAIYQLPYMAYSDNGPVNNLGSYDHARGHIHSLHLNWSFGGMRGREGDWFYRKLAQLPISEQVAVVAAMGFSGIYIDRRGYLDTKPENVKRCTDFLKTQVSKIKNNCLSFAELEQEIANTQEVQTATKPFVSADQQLVFIPLKSQASTANASVAVAQTNQANAYLLAIGFQLVNGFPQQVEGGFETAIDFRKDDPDMPHYYGDVTGVGGISISNGERLGRWSDALKAKHVTVWLTKPLPKKFQLQITASAAGLNTQKPMTIKIGDQTQTVLFGAGFETKSVNFETNKPVYKIELIPADPFSPARRWGSGVNDLIAIHFQKILIESP